MTALLILDDPQASAAPLEELAPGARVVVFVVTPDSVWVRRVSAELTAQGHTVELVNAAGRLDEAADQLHSRYSALIAAAPDAIPVGNKSLRRAFVADGRLSLWWINLLFAKRSDAFPTFNRLCQLHLLRQLVTEHKVDACHLLTRDADFVAVVRSACGIEGVRLFTSKAESRHQRKLSWVRVAADSIVWFVKTLVQSVFVQRWAGPQPDLDRDRPLVAFHTIYPLQWRRSGDSAREEKFGRTPQQLAATGRTAPVYVNTFLADGHHQRVGIRRFRTMCHAFKAGDFGETEGVPTILLDAFSHPADVARCFVAQLATVWRYAQLEQQTTFRRHWQLDGVDIFPLIQTEWRLAARRTGNYLAYAARVRRFVEHVQPGAIVYTMFEYGLGRALVYGARSAETPASPRLIAAQEGPITQYKMMNVHAPGELGREGVQATQFIDSAPMPDAVLLEGNVSRICLAQAGYPPDTLLVRGAPRLTRLAHAPRARPGPPTPPITVLVAFWGYGAESMLVRTLPLLRPGYRVLFKVHPRGDMNASAIESWLDRRAPDADYAVVTGDIYALFAETDIVVVSSSSVANEAAALGYPTVCLQLPNLVTATPLMDMSLPTVRFAADDEALLAAVDAFSTGQIVGDGDEVERALFDRLDGRSDERWAATIDQLVLGE